MTFEETGHANGPSDVFEGRVPTMVRLQLAELVAANGSEILGDPRRVRAMLSDTAATATREINLINLALSEGVPERLVAAASDRLRLQTETENLVRQLVRNNALHHDAAEWAVRSCAWALGLDTPPENLEPVIPTPAPGPASAPTSIADPDPAPAATEELLAPDTITINDASAPTVASLRPRHTRRIVAIAGASIIAVLGIIALLLAITGGSGSGGSDHAAAPPARTKSFTPEARRLMTAVPRIAPMKSCVAISGSGLRCAVELGDTSPGGPSAEHVEYFAHSTPGEAESDAFSLATRRAVATTWTTTSGQPGGKQMTWTESSPGDVFHHLAWTFRIGDTYYAATTSSCCDDAAGAAMLTGWTARAITSDQLGPITSG